MLSAFVLPASGRVRDVGLPFRSDLEAEDAGCWASRPNGTWNAAGCGDWKNIGQDAVIALATGEKAHSGRKAIRLRFAKDEEYGGALIYISSRHVFTRFYTLFDTGFDFAAGMKVHRLSGFNADKQVNDFDVIVYANAQPNADGVGYCGLSDMTNVNIGFNGGPSDWGVAGGMWAAQRGRWYCVEAELKLNDPGQGNGEARLWVDGQLIGSKTGINISGTSTVPINRVMFGGWYSNGNGGRNPCRDPVQPSVRYIDDVAIAESRIGPLSGDGSGPMPGRPPAPRNLPAHDYDPIPD